MGFFCDGEREGSGTIPSINSVTLNWLLSNSNAQRGQKRNRISTPPITIRYWLFFILSRSLSLIKSHGRNKIYKKKKQKNSVK